VIEDVGTSPHAGQIIRGADEAARARGYNLLVINTSGSAGPESRESEVESLLVRRVDGILYAPTHHRQLQLPASLGSIPAVLVGGVSSGSNVAAVVPDGDGGARAAVGCLLAAGHTRIGFINSNDEAAAQDRHRAFLAALSRAGLDGGAAAESVPAGFVRAGSVPAESVPAEPVTALPLTAEPVQPNEQRGYAAARRMLARADRPTGLVCQDEATALGVYRAAAELGLAIPADLSVAAFADHQLLAANLYPALTTVTLPHYDMAYRATEILIDGVEGKAGPAGFARHPTALACTLVARGSVGPPPFPATPRGNF
jgi:LacI family transcriptional regulator